MGEDHRRNLWEKKHKMEQRIFAKEYWDKSQSFWENVFWTDETKPKLCGNSLFTDSTMKLTRKKTSYPLLSGGGSIMLWGCFATSCTGVLDYHRNNETGKLPRGFRAECVGKLGSSPSARQNAHKQAEGVIKKGKSSVLF